MKLILLLAILVIFIAIRTGLYLLSFIGKRIFDGIQITISRLDWNFTIENERTLTNIILCKFTAALWDCIPSSRPMIFMLAEHGDGLSQYILGQAYLFGTNVILPAPEKSSKWFIRAANNGCSEAKYYLGIMYCRGIGVHHSLRTGLAYLNQAAREGVYEAQEAYCFYKIHM